MHDVRCQAIGGGFCWSDFGPRGASKPAPIVSGNRLAAALASGGASSDRIHDAAFAEIVRDGLAGVALDFGAGRGEFASRLAATDRFDRVYAADLVRFGDPPRDVQWIEADLNEPLPLPDDSCDLIAAIEVVEHLENIRAVSREWARLLRPGGSVVLTTPNNESLRAILSLVFRGNFIAFIGDSYPAHITALLRADLEHALAEAGLRTERFFYTDEGVIPRLTRVTWQTASGARLRGLRFSDNLGCVARRDEA
jgi:2-polyprenyl-3-methyl-5-hydroxy-6-metoxy-1,4-benzoquinol methylase